MKHFQNDVNNNQQFGIKSRFLYNFFLKKRKEKKSKYIDWDFTHTKKLLTYLVFYLPIRPLDKHPDNAEEPNL